MKIYIATSNKHKIAEFAQMFAAAGVDAQVFGADDVCGFVPPEETGTTFRENAFIKARALKKLVGNSYVMADDSGIVVDALGGAPGIFSARYAGIHGSDADNENNKKLLRELENVPDEKRSARFVCDIALICPDGREFNWTGTIEGFINRGEKGAGGFGYDPLFYVPRFGKTTAELSPEEKNAVSHRGAAFGQLADFLIKQQQ